MFSNEICAKYQIKQNELANKISMYIQIINKYVIVSLVGLIETTYNICKIQNSNPKRKL